MSILRLDGVAREVGTFVILDHVTAAIALGDRIISTPHSWQHRTFAPPSDTAPRTSR
jgi:hypothetical protein